MNKRMRRIDECLNLKELANQAEKNENVNTNGMNDNGDTLHPMLFRNGTPPKVCPDAPRKVTSEEYKIMVQKIKEALSKDALSDNPKICKKLFD